MNAEKLLKSVKDVRSFDSLSPDQKSIVIRYAESSAMKALKNLPDTYEERVAHVMVRHGIIEEIAKKMSKEEAASELVKLGMRQEAADQCIDAYAFAVALNRRDASALYGGLIGGVLLWLAVGGTPGIVAGVLAFIIGFFVTHYIMDKRVRRQNPVASATEPEEDKDHPT